MQNLKDLWETLKAHKILTIYIVAIMLIVSTFYGCQAKCESLMPDGKMVTRNELQAEVDFFIAKAKARFSELDRQDEFLKAITDFTTVSLQTGELNPSGLLITLLGMFGAGTIGNYAGKTTTAKKLNSPNPTET